MEEIVMKINYLLIGLAALVAVVPQTGLAQGFCHWSYSSGQSICNTNSGDVGIGTTTPEAKLEVNSNFYGGGPTIVVRNLEEEGDGVIDFQEFEGNLRGNIGMGGLEESSPRFIINSVGILDTVLNEGGGKVGIGVTSPVRTLHVKDVLRLEPQSSAPSGGKGDLYASTGGKLYFHNGSDWQELEFAP
jgi:hypothetical protein